MIAVVSDTHLPRGGRVLPSQCLEILAGASLIVHAGDFSRAGVLGYLEELGPAAVLAVHGNVDDDELRKRLPARATGGAEGVRIGVVHDAGRSKGRHRRLVEWFPGCDVVVYGHSHLPEIARVASTWILNPGSPTERRRAPARSMAVIRDGVPELIEL